VWGNLGGWELADAVAAGHPETAIEGQGAVRGDFSWALIMFGTNDIDEGGWVASSWKEDLRDFVNAWEESAVIPVLSTIPPELAHVGTGRVEAANVAIADLAEEEDIPLVDFHALILAYQPVSWLGTLISNDAATAGRGFSQAALTSTDGYALRTKLAFDVAEKLRAIVFDDGPPDVDPTASPERLDASTRGLVRAFPNPTRGGVSFSCGETLAAAAQHVIFDARGRVVRAAMAGTHWDGRDATGRPVPAGVYFVAVEAGGERGVVRVTVLR
jgi:hypothetical protein